MKRISSCRIPTVLLLLVIVWNLSLLLPTSANINPYNKGARIVHASYPEFHSNQQSLQYNNNNNHNNNNRNLQQVGLKERYAIERPIFQYQDLQFDLEYSINDVIGDTLTEYKVFDGHECSLGNNDITSITTTGNQTAYLVSRLRPDLNPGGNGTGTRSMKVSLTLDPHEIRSSPLYFDYKSYGIVNFCVRFSVYNMDILDPEALEVNFIETPIALTIELLDDFVVDIGQFSNAELVVELAYQDSAVEAYICDSDANVIQSHVQSQGESVRVCVVPTQQSLQAGALLSHIEEFTFARGDLLQIAIAPETMGEPADSLTVVSCEAGSELCAFETFLGEQFFQGDVGVIVGTGSAYLQLGETEEGEEVVAEGGGGGEGATRRLVEVVSEKRRTLQSASELLAARPTGFAFEIVTLPGTWESGGSRPSGCDSIRMTWWMIMLFQMVTTIALLQS